MLKSFFLILNVDSTFKIHSLIILNNVGKRYRFEWIFRQVNQDFEAGKQYAILGPNGSGKSTLLQILSGHLSPSEGQVDFYFNEKKAEPEEVFRQVSIAGPYMDVIEEFTLLEALQFHQKFKPYLHGLQANDLIDILSFSASKHKEVRFFSSGMKQRLKLALALCSDTPLVLLDEPTTNLDTQGVEWYRSLIEKFATNRTLIIASNIEHDYDFCETTLQITDFK